MRLLRNPRVFAALVTLAISGVARADDEAPRITHTPVEQAVRADGLTVSATMTDDHEIFAPTLYVRSVGAESYESVMMLREGDVYTARAPVDGDVEYWLEAYDEYGNGPARHGTPSAPHRVRMVAQPAAQPSVAAAPTAPPSSSAPPAVQPSTAPPQDLLLASPGEDAFLLHVEPVPVYRRWWFLTGAGVVGVAAAGALVYALRPDDVHRNTFGATVTRP